MLTICWLVAVSFFTLLIVFSMFGRRSYFQGVGEAASSDAGEHSFFMIAILTVFGMILYVVALWDGISFIGSRIPEPGTLLNGMTGWAVLGIAALTYMLVLEGLSRLALALHKGFVGAFR